MRYLQILLFFCLWKCGTSCADILVIRLYSRAKIIENVGVYMIFFTWQVGQPQGKPWKHLFKTWLIFTMLLAGDFIGFTSKWQGWILHIYYIYDAFDSINDKSITYHLENGNKRLIFTLIREVNKFYCHSNHYQFKWINNRIL